jgi:hypothetical protein
MAIYFKTHNYSYTFQGHLLLEYITGKRFKPPHVA